jgi:hypothetical protein
VFELLGNRAGRQDTPTKEEPPLMSILDISHVISFLAGLVGGYGLKFVVDKRQDSSNRAIQKNNTIKGNQAGRDLNVKK